MCNGVTEGHEYARVLKYNFGRDELSVLIDAISLIKSLSSLMCRAEATLSPYVRFHIHHRIQQLVQVRAAHYVPFACGFVIFWCILNAKGVIRSC